MRLAMESCCVALASPALIGWRIRSPSFSAVTQPTGVTATPRGELSRPTLARTTPVFSSRCSINTRSAEPSGMSFTCFESSDMPFRTLSFLAAEARCIKWTSGMKGRRGVLRADLVVGDNAVSDSMLFETLVFQIFGEVCSLDRFILTRRAYCNTIAKPRHIAPSTKVRRTNEPPDRRVRSCESVRVERCARPKRRCKRSPRSSTGWLSWSSGGQEGALPGAG